MGYSVPTIALEIAHHNISIILACYCDIAWRGQINGLHWEVWRWPNLNIIADLLNWFVDWEAPERPNVGTITVTSPNIPTTQWNWWWCSGSYTNRDIGQQKKPPVHSLHSPRQTLNFSSNLKSWSFWKIRQYRVSKQHQVKFQSRSRKLMTPGSPCLSLVKKFKIWSYPVLDWIMLILDSRE